MSRKPRVVDKNINVRSSVEIEVMGLLLKKNSKGFFQTRYFKTQGHNLKYWADVRSCESGAPPSNIFDINEINNIEKPGNKVFVIYFMNEKFKLELKAPSDEKFLEWTELISAKRALYSVHDLLEDLSADSITFQTKTFENLLAMKEKNQIMWILDKLDDVFSSVSDEYSKKTHKSDPGWVLIASKICVDELIITCDECLLEMKSRNPKLMAHCRYADIVKGRLALELSSFIDIGSGKKKLSGMGERSLCLAIDLMNRMEVLRSYSFMPHNLVSSLNAMLFSTGELISALLNLAIERVEAWYVAWITIPTAQRSHRFVEVTNVIKESVSQVHIQSEDAALRSAVIQKIAVSQLLSLSDLISMYTFEDYDESSLSGHIKACHEVVHRFRAMTIVLPAAGVMTDEQVPVLNDERLVVKDRCDGQENEDGGDSGGVSSAAAVAGNDAASAAASVTRTAVEENVVHLPAAALDAIKSACGHSARLAAATAVAHLTLAVDTLLVCLINEKVTGWIGGSACQALIDRLNSWALSFTVEIPSGYTILVNIEIGRLMVKLYLRQLINRYKDNKRTKLSARGIQQIGEDLELLHRWILQTLDTTEIMDEQHLLMTLRQLLLATPETFLQCYSDAIIHFGIQYAWQLYDLVRLILKLRSDFRDSKSRKGILGLCTELVAQLQVVSEGDPTLLQGLRKKFANVTIFEDLCPLVGTEHCTGKKWSLEALSDPMAVHVLIARLVTDACTVARNQRRTMKQQEKQLLEDEMKLRAHDDMEAIPIHCGDWPTRQDNECKHENSATNSSDCAVNKNPFADDSDTDGGEGGGEDEGDEAHHTEMEDPGTQRSHSMSSTQSSSVPSTETFPEPAAATSLPSSAAAPALPPKPPSKPAKSTKPTPAPPAAASSTSSVIVSADSTIILSSTPEPVSALSLLLARAQQDIKNI